jgi:cellulose synthase/poly-beta-1,6-N-acetylglucosamine synthase-like glycosyltransferase
MDTFFLWLFWLSVGTIVYTFLLFPIILILRSLIFQKKIKSSRNFTPGLSIIVAAYNEEDGIEAKLDNLLESNYPRENMEILVASDGSTDGTNRIVEAYSAPEVKLIAFPRLGKNRAISKAAESAQNDIIVFTDADSLLAPDSLSFLIAPFADQNIGGVSGDYQLVGKGIRQEGEKAYWNYDRWLKRLQTKGGSVSAASGALYAMRRELFSPVPISVTDDFYNAMKVVSAHKRLIFESRAVTFGPPAPTAKTEYKRKIRIITRGLHGVWLHKRLLNPIEYGFFAIQLFSHKVLRRLMVIPIFFLMVSSLFLTDLGWFYQITALGQIVFHLIAVLGFFLQKNSIGQSRVINLPFHFDLVYFASAVAIINNLRGIEFSNWGPVRPSKSREV